jgi:hypothetical protein
MHVLYGGHLFSFLSINTWVTLTDFQMLNNPLIPGISPLEYDALSF